jgi:hypothetical protein
MRYGVANPEIKEAFTVAPEVVYSPIVPKPSLTTNRSEPDTAMPTGPPLKPKINEAFTVVPEVVYSPMMPPAGLATNRLSARAAQLDSNPSRTAASHGVLVAFTVHLQSDEARTGEKIAGFAKPALLKNTELTSSLSEIHYESFNFIFRVLPYSHDCATIRLAEAIASPFGVTLALVSLRNLKLPAFCGSGKGHVDTQETQMCK